LGRRHGQAARRVDIFFVVSGFVIMVTGRHLAPGTFFIRRVNRVAPLYWLLTCALAALALVAPVLRLSKRLIAVRRDVRVGFAVERW
jgi:peptidoglycan/LPS O-acetylase OafA/YrhL